MDIPLVAWGPEFAENGPEAIGVVRIARQVFGEVATGKVAHSRKLVKQVPEEELDRDDRSEQAVTVALRGLRAEERLIAQRLGRLGRKKPWPQPAHAALEG